MGAIASRQTQEIWRTQRAFETLKRIYSIRGNYNNFHFHLQFLLPALIVILFASSSLQSMYLCLDFPVPNLCERCKAINTIPGGGVFAGAGGLGANPSNQACDLLTRFFTIPVLHRFFFSVSSLHLLNRSHDLKSWHRFHDWKAWTSSLEAIPPLPDLVKEVLNQ